MGVVAHVNSSTVLQTSALSLEESKSKEEEIAKLKEMLKVYQTKENKENVSKNSNEQE